MRNSRCSLTLALGGLTAALALAGHAHGDSVEPLVHTQARFALTARAPFAQVAPPFGALRERVWAPDWNPQLSIRCPRLTYAAWSSPFATISSIRSG